VASEKDKKPGRVAQHPAPYDEDTIRGLAKLLDETGLTEIEIERGGERIRIGRAARPVNVSAPAIAATPGIATAPAAGADLAKHPGMLPSPMVGTAYLQAEPEAPAFVKVGDPVTEGQTVLIIEAMKTMNQIAAPRAGRIKRLLVADGQPVEFGAPLFILE
jgi:acetyl-CoA carboxylase biotin carboxyl carrier protein